MIAIYARQSVDKKDSISIETQIAECKYEARKANFEVYQDKGFSGKNLDRDDFKRMMDDIRAGKISKVIVYRLDRISRSVLDFSNIMEVFKKHKVEFNSCKEKFDTSTPMGAAMLNVSIVFAQLERETIQQRVTDTYASRSRSGFYMGGRIPYGFQRSAITINNIKTSQYIPIPEEVIHIQIIYAMYAKPITSLADIVRYFKNNNMIKLRGVNWNTSRLTEILRNPIYVQANMDIYSFYQSRQTEIINDMNLFTGTNGCYLYTKNINQSTSTVNTRGRYNNMFLVLAPHAGIVDADTFIRCQLKAEENLCIPNGRRAYTSWISGKLKCPKCGYAMRYNKWIGKTTLNEYYLCSAVASKKCDGVGAVHKDMIESVVFRQLNGKIKTMKIEQRQPDLHQADINAVKAIISAKEKEIEKTLENFSTASQTVIQYMNSTVDILVNDISELQTQIVKLETSKCHSILLDTDSIEIIFANWNNISKEDKQTMADILIKKVLVSKTLIEIIWKI